MGMHFGSIPRQGSAGSEGSAATSHLGKLGCHWPVAVLFDTLTSGESSTIPTSATTWCYSASLFASLTRIILHCHSNLYLFDYSCGLSTFSNIP